MRILIVFALILLLAAPAFAQSSQSLGYDLSVLKWNVHVCISDAHYLYRNKRGPQPPPDDQLREYCIKRALERYRQQVDTEEKLIEGMTKHCCPNVRQQPVAPYYREPKEYKNVEGVRPQGGERDELERMMARLKEGMK